ncbi:MAG: hypothetical protein ACFFCX_17635 [Candidatus Sifarchaeia archaeon]
MAFSVPGFGQCDNVRDLPDSVQKKILAKFLDLERCDSLQATNKREIMLLRSDILALQDDNVKLNNHIVVLNDKALKRKKWPWIAGAIGFAGGIYLGTRIR